MECRQVVPDFLEMYKPETDAPNFDDDITDDENPDGEQETTGDVAFTGIPMGNDGDDAANGANGAWGANGDANANGDWGASNGAGDWDNGNGVPAASGWG